MNSKRWKDLMLAAASALDDGRDPFSDAFLIEHNVTLDECRVLSQAMARAIEAHVTQHDAVAELLR